MKSLACLSYRYKSCEIDSVRLIIDYFMEFMFIREDEAFFKESVTHRFPAISTLFVTGTYQAAPTKALYIAPSPQPFRVEVHAIVSNNVQHVMLHNQTAFGSGTLETSRNNRYARL